MLQKKLISPSYFQKQYKVNNETNRFSFHIPNIRKASLNLSKQNFEHRYRTTWCCAL